MNNLQARFISRCHRASLGWLGWLLTLAGAGAQTIEFLPGSPSVFENGTNVSVVVTRSPAVGAAWVDFTTRDLTATAGMDYVTNSGTLTFADGETYKLITIDLIQDFMPGNAKQFEVVLRNPVGGTLGKATVTVTIFDVDTSFQLEFPRYQVREDSTNLIIKVLRVGGTNGMATVDYYTWDGTATNDIARPGVDYVTRAGRLVFNDGQASADIVIPILHDCTVTTNRTFAVMLTNAVASVLGNPIAADVTIQEVDTGAGMIGFSSASLTLIEGFNGARSATIYVSRGCGTSGQVGIEYRIVNGFDQCLGTTNALNNFDYTITGSLSWGDGDGNNKTLTITLPDNNDNYVELDEFVWLQLYNPSGGATVDTPRQFLTVTIISDDSPAGANDPDYNFATITNPNPGANGAVYGIAVYTNVNDANFGEAVLVGDFSAVNSTIRNRIARLQTNGVLDTTFDPGSGANGFVGSIAIQPDGNILVAGGFSSINNTARRGVARLRPDGSLDTSFNPGFGADAPVLALELQADGKILIAGDFLRFNNVARSHVARLNANGSLDNAFNPGPGPDDSVYAVAVQPDGKVVLGGMFQSTAGEQITSIVRLLANGQVDAGFMPLVGADDTVFAVKIMPGGKVLLGGAFTAFDGESRRGIAQLNGDGSLDATFNPGTGFSGPVYAIALQANGQPVLGGDFAVFNGTPRRHLARLYPNGILDTLFMDSYYNQTQAGTEGIINALAVQPDGNVLIGGGFAKVGGDNGGTMPKVHQATAVATRYNFTRLIGGDNQPARNAPGNIQLVSATFSIDENAAGRNVAVLLERVNGTVGPLVVDYTTSDGSAFAGKDYTATSGQFTWNDCDPSTMKVINIPINDNAIIDGNRTFYFTLSNPGGGGVNAVNEPALGYVTRAEITILDDDASAGVLSFSSPVFEVREDVSGRTAYITVLRTNGATGRVTVQYGASDGTATAPADYTATSGTLTFASGETNKTFPVRIVNDTAIEPEETIQLRLSAPGGATLGQDMATLLVFDSSGKGPGSLSFATNSFNVGEGDGHATITIRRTSGSVGKIWATLTSSDPAPGPGAARDGIDYLGVNQMVKFESGVAELTVPLPILPDDLIEGDEYFNLTLSGIQGGGTLGAISNAVVRITDDDFYGRLGFANENYYLKENDPDHAARIRVARVGGSSQTVSVDYRVTPMTAVDGVNFVSTNGTLVFSNQVTEQFILVPVLEDGRLDPNLTVALTLTNFSKASPGPITAAQLTIVDDMALAAASGSIDTVFDPLPGPNAPVRAVAVQGDGKLVVGGEFTAYNLFARRRVARLLPDGSVDPDFRPGNGANRNINALVVQPDGKVVVGGEFTTLGNRNRNYLGRLNQNGAVDTSFDPGAGLDGAVYALALQADGNVLAGGAFTNLDGLPASRLVRLLPDGRRDTAFAVGAGLDGEVDAIAVQEDGRILIGGAFTQYNGQGVFYLARLHSNGNLDAAFNVTDAPNGPVRTIALDSAGRILIGGAFTALGVNRQSGIARLQSDGTLDPAFNLEGGANGVVNSLAVQNNGKVIVAGEFSRMAEMPRTRIARLNVDGTIDLSIDFGSGPNNTVNAVALQPDEQIVIGGKFTAVNGYPRQYLARLMGGYIQSAGIVEFSSPNYQVAENGGSLLVRVVRSQGSMGQVELDAMTLDQTATAGLDYVGTNLHLVFLDGETIKSFSIPILDDPLVEADETFGLVLANVMGEAQVGAQAAVKVTILDDDCYVGFTASTVYGLENAANGRVTISLGRIGSTNKTVSVAYATAGGTATPGVDYMATNGVLTFAPGETNKSLGITLLDDLLVEGDETVELVLSDPVGTAIADGAGTATLVIVDNDFNLPGSADPAFDPGAGANSYVRCLAVQSDGRIVVGGAFTSFGATKRGGIARLLPNGTNDPSFDPGAGANAIVSALAVLPDGRMALAGAFTSFDGLPYSRVTRVLPDGSVDTELNSLPVFNSPVNALAAYTNGAVVVVGGFNAPLPGLAQLRRDGSIDILFSPGSGATRPIFAILQQPDGYFVLGGSFTTFNGVSRLGIARLRADGTLDLGFNAPAIASGTVYALALQPDGRILVGGSITLTNGSARVNVARLNPDGSLDESFQPGSGANGTVYALGLQASGKILLGGDFTAVNGITRGYYARVLASGAVDAGFDSSQGANSTVYALAVLPNGDIIIGGDFTKVKNVLRAGVAQVSGQDHDLRFTSIGAKAGRMRLVLNVSPGLTYLLEASTDLAAWTLIDTRQAIGSSIEFDPPAAPGDTQMFFRARQGP